MEATEPANPPYPPFAKGGKLSSYEASNLQETGALPLPKGGLRGISVPIQLMHETIPNPKHFRAPTWAAT